MIILWLQFLLQIYWYDCIKHFEFNCKHKQKHNVMFMHKIQILCVCVIEWVSRFFKKEVNTNWKCSVCRVSKLYSQKQKLWWRTLTNCPDMSETQQRFNEMRLNEMKWTVYDLYNTLPEESVLIQTSKHSTQHLTQFQLTHLIKKRNPTSKSVTSWNLLFTESCRLDPLKRR